ncbi:hypothetical protein JW796_03940 [Candidatus Dojkabacteria bacterium]|nr:hypothetical protein [Candidatus Dojkabacteria bacterium]
MVFPRKILKLYLSFLSRLAIKKHSMELIIIVGWHSTEIVREAIYEILNEKFLVRRNVKNLWWDLSVPLTVLGYKDKKRNMAGWFIVCVRALFYLIVGQRNPHKIILNLNTVHSSTADFWTEFIKPDFLIIVNQKTKSRLIENLIENTEKNSGKVIYDPLKSKFQFERAVGFTFGEEKNVDLKVVEGKNCAIYKYKNQSVRLSYSILPKFSSHFFASALSLGVSYGVSLINASFAALKVDFHSRLIPKIISKI